MPSAWAYPRRMVNKWERSASYPDITLLPPLARTLGIDLNTLLSFQEDMTREEIAHFMNELSETARTEGCGAAFQMARDKLREFPNSEALAYNVAGVLDGALTLCPDKDAQETAARREEIFELYERASRSADPEIRGWANYALISRCMTKGDMERAEELLEQLPDTHRGKSDMKAALRRKQGRSEEAWIILEGELLNRANDIQSTLRCMIDLSLEEGDMRRAHELSQAAQEAGRILYLMGYVVNTAPFLVAMAEEDGPAALAILEKMLQSMTAPWRLDVSPLYHHIPTKDDSGEVWQMMRQSLLDELERDPKCAFLRNMPEYQALMEHYRP